MKVQTEFAKKQLAFADEIFKQRKLALAALEQEKSPAVQNAIIHLEYMEVILADYLASNKDGFLAPVPARFHGVKSQTPQTESIIDADTGDSSLIFNLAQLCRKFELQLKAVS